MQRYFFASFVLVLPLAGAHASIPIQTEVTCAIGGEKFEGYELVAYSTWGNRPDGKPYGSALFPVPFPTCPTNGLAMFDKFSADELVRLEVLIASPEYKDAIATQTPYYRAYWLAKALGRSRDQQRNLLLQAVWENETASRTDYLRLFLEYAPPIEGSSISAGDGWWQVRFANAERELEQFAQASSRLSRLRKMQVHADDKTGDNKKEAAFLKSYAAKLQKVAAAKDSSIAPRSLIKRDWVASSEY